LTTEIRTEIEIKNYFHNRNITGVDNNGRPSSTDILRPTPRSTNAVTNASPRYYLVYLGLSQMTTAQCKMFNVH